MRPSKHIPLVQRRQFLIAALAAAGGLILGWLFPRRLAAVLFGATATNDPQAEVGDFSRQWSTQGYAPARSKSYAGADRIALPDPAGYRGLSLEEAVEQRRSRRDYVAKPLSLIELSRLLHAAGGLTEPVRGLRAAPSAGALYPIEIYVVVSNMTELAPGLYHYIVADHTLERLRSGDLRPALLAAGLGQEMLGQAAVCFILSAIFQRTRSKSKDRAYRYILLEAGHIGQSLYLQATSLGLGACAAGAFLDDQLNDLLGLDGEEEAALYMIVVGKV